VPTWDETKAYIRGKYKFVVDESWLGLHWRLAGPSEPVLQRQRVEQVQAFGEPHLLVSCDVVLVDQLAPEAALRHNMTLAVGFLGLVENGYHLRAVLALEALTWGVLDRTLEFTAHEAARLRHVHTVPPPNVPPFQVD
jgi:hypothetical protein